MLQLIHFLVPFFLSIVKTTLSTFPLEACDRCDDSYSLCLPIHINVSTSRAFIRCSFPHLNTSCHARERCLSILSQDTRFGPPLFNMIPNSSRDAPSYYDGRQSRGDATPKTAAPVAIIGMACRLSGDVSSLEDFWEMICRGRNGWSEIPEDRFSKGAFWHPNPAKKGAFNPRGGYFLKQDPALFDAPFFNITRAEAEAMGMFLTSLHTISEPLMHCVP